MKEFISFTPQKYLKLKRIYKKAEKEGKEQFEFEGHTVLTQYAKYMLQYLGTKFERKLR